MSLFNTLHILIVVQSLTTLYPAHYLLSLGDGLSSDCESNLVDIFLTYSYEANGWYSLRTLQ